MPSTLVLISCDLSRIVRDISFAIHNKKFLATTFGRQLAQFSARPLCSFPLIFHIFWSDYLLPRDNLQILLCSLDWRDAQFPGDDSSRCRSSIRIIIPDLLKVAPRSGSSRRAGSLVVLDLHGLQVPVDDIVDGWSAEVLLYEIVNCLWFAFIVG